jgi:SP family sugar porter-like MFS transporter
MGSYFRDLPQSPSLRVCVGSRRGAVDCFIRAPYTFPFINRAFSTAGAFPAYAAICFCGFLFVFRFVPETRGKTLEEIERFSAAKA